MKKNKGFTLIELLAVIVILGIILVISVISIGKIIETSKKNTYISNTISFISSAKSKAVFDNTTTGTRIYKLKDLDVTNTKESPFSKYLWGYVIINCESNSCKYYYTSLDETGNMIGNIKEYKTEGEDGFIVEPVEAQMINNDNMQVLQLISIENLKKIENMSLNQLGETSDMAMVISSLEKFYNNKGNTINFKLPSSDGFVVARSDGTAVITDKIYKAGWTQYINLNKEKNIKDIFVVIEDRGDKLILVQQTEKLFANNANATINIKKTLDYIKAQWINKGIKVRLLNFNDLKQYIDNPSKVMCELETCTNPATNNLEKSFDEDIITRFNINNADTASKIVNIMGNKSASTITLNRTFIADNIKFNDDGTTNTKIICPTLITFEENTTLPKRSYIIYSYNGAARVKFVIEIDKNKLDDLIIK